MNKDKIRKNIIHDVDDYFKTFNCVTDMVISANIIQIVNRHFGVHK